MKDDSSLTLAGRSVAPSVKETEWDAIHKQTAREADNRIVARGGRSIFGMAWRFSAPKTIGAPLKRATKTVPLEKDEVEAITALRHRPRNPAWEFKPGNRTGSIKPGRLVAGLSSKLGGYADDLE